MTGMKVIFLVKRFYTNKDLIEDRFGRLFHIPVQLATRGYDCTVVALDYKSRPPLDIVIKGVRFISTPIVRPDRLIRLLTSLKQYRFDFVFSSGDSYLGLLGLWLSKYYRANSIFDIYDDYATFGTNRIPFMKRALKYAVSRSDIVIAASKAIGNTYGNKDGCSYVIENGVDLGVFKPMERARVRQCYELDSTSRVVGYFGSIHEPRGSDILIDAVRLLRFDDGFGDVLLLMAGTIASDIDLSEPWIDYRGMVVQDEVAKLINCCDVAVLPYRDTPTIRMTNACKITEYIACGVPIVISDVGDYSRYADDPACVCRPGDSVSLYRSIKHQLEFQIGASLPPELTWDALGSRLATILKEVSSPLRNLSK